MTTNQDIMTFLQASQAAREKEKEEDKRMRAEERKEDMRQIFLMIEKGIKTEV